MKVCVPVLIVSLLGGIWIEAAVPLLRRIQVLTVASNLGGEVLGVAAAPDALLSLAGRSGSRVFEGARIVIVPPADGEEGAFFKNARALIGLTSNIAQAVRQARQDDLIPVVVGGDNAQVYGTIAGLRSHQPAQPLAVVKISRFYDRSYPEMTESGAGVGMALGAALPVPGRLCRAYLRTVCARNAVSDETNTLWHAYREMEAPSPKVLPGHVVHVGANSAGGKVKRVVSEMIRGIYNCPLAALRSDVGIRATLQAALRRLDGLPIHVVVDLSGINLQGPLSKPEVEGLSADEIVQAARIVAETGRVCGVDFVGLCVEPGNEDGSVTQQGLDIIEAVVDAVSNPSFIDAALDNDAVGGIPLVGLQSSGYGRLAG